jgi:hypothetical protein
MDIVFKTAMHSIRLVLRVQQQFPGVNKHQRMWNVLPNTFNFGTGSECSASHPGLFTTEERALCSHWAATGQASVLV